MPAYTPKRTGSPDTTNGVPLATIPSSENSSVFVPVNTLAVAAMGGKPAAHRTFLAAVDTATDLSSAGFGTSLYTVNNDAGLLVWGETSGTNSLVKFTPVWYDVNGLPLFVDQEYTLTGTNKRVSSAGNFVSLPVSIGNRGLPKVKLYITSISGIWDLFLHSY